MSTKLRKYLRCAAAPVCRVTKTAGLLLCLGPILALSQSSLSLSSATAGIGSAVDLNLAYSSTRPSRAAAVQWTLNYSSSDIKTVTVSPAMEATGAGKTIVCAGENGSYTCVAAGILNQNAIPDGAFASVHLVLSAHSSSSIPIQVSNVVAAGPTGNALAITGIPGVISTNEPRPTIVSPSEPAPPLQHPR